MGSRALVIANSRYDDGHFADLPAASADAAALAGVLADPAIGGFEVDQLVDADQRTAMRALESFFTSAKPDDLLLLHLSLHGWKDLRNRLYFVVRDTERDYPGATAIPAELVSDWMAQSRSRRIVLMLDCCYSGAFTINTQRRSAQASAVDIAEPFAGNGRVVITASTALQFAHEGEQDVRFSWTKAQPSVFTAAVVRGLRDGSADLDGDGLISVDDLYDYVHEQVRQRIAGQTPTLSVDNAQGVIYLARSPRHTDSDLLAEMRGAVIDAQAWKRIGALHLVERLLGSVREPTRDTAKAALLQLIADTDREVARRARELWNARGLGEIPTAVRPARPPRPTPRQPTQTGRPAIGIDFGTTNSAIGLIEGGDVRLIPNAEGHLTTPSLVAIAADGTTLVGTAAKRQALTNPEYTVRSVKLKLGTGWSIARGDVRLTAEDAAALILARLRTDAEAYLGGPMNGAVLTVPANFGQAQRFALARAAENAGITAWRMVNEPTAAAVTFGLNRQDDLTVLIFDLGGGTLDVSILEVSDGVVEVKSTAGENCLGGDDWDRRIVQHLAGLAQQRYGVDLADDTAAMRRLQEAAEAAKVALSSARTAEVQLPYLATTLDSPFHLHETMDRDAFEAITRDILECCRRPVERALRDAGIGPSGIDHVILTGGATRMPAIGRLVGEITGGKHVYRGLIPEGVVTGATLQAGILTGYVKDVLLLDVTSAPIGVETDGGLLAQVAERNTTIPTLATEIFATSRDGQTATVLHFAEGGEPTIHNNKSLAVLELSGLSPAPRGTPVIEVIIDIDANGILNFSAKELRGAAKMLPAKAAELRRLRAEQRAAWPRIEIPAEFYTGREVTVTVDESSTRQARQLLESDGWPALRQNIPSRW